MQADSDEIIHRWVLKFGPAFTPIATRYDQTPRAFLAILCPALGAQRLLLGREGGVGRGAGGGGLGGVGTTHFW